MFNFLKKKREIMQEQPLQYWEEYSYMAAIPINDKEYELGENAIDRVRALDDIKLTGSMLPVEDEGIPGKLIVDYKGEEYEFFYFYSDFELHEMYFHQAQFFSEDEMYEMKNIKKALIGYMKFGVNVRESYILQLRLLKTLMPEVLAFQDESAEKILNRRWVELTLSSLTVCEMNALYSVQMVQNNENDIWLHTHGLARCGYPELEILKSNKDVINAHYEAISAFSDKLLSGDYNEEENYVLLGQFFTGEPIIATKRSWTNGILEYNNKVLGTEKDRKNGHNSRSDIIFIYTSEENLRNNIINTLDIVDEQIQENPIFYYSTAETERMKIVAKERFSYVRRIMDRPDRENNMVLIKMGLATDSGESADEKEHIWFELLGLDGDLLKLKLTQEPYDIGNLHEGDEGEYDLDDMTDWLIYSSNGRIEPATAYLLDF